MKITISDQFLTLDGGFAVHRDCQAKASFTVDRKICPDDHLKSTDLYCTAAEVATKMAERHLTDFCITGSQRGRFYHSNNRCSSFLGGSGAAYGLITKHGSHSMEVIVKVSLVGRNSSAFQQFTFTIEGI